ncbi:AMT-4.1 protein, partial [Aphelenchoides avenae]
MQCGFAFLEAGAVRSKNTTNILMTNVCDSLIAIIGYWSVGWALAYGPNSSVLAPFVGGSQFFMSDSANLAKFFFQYVFAATAATITSGAVAERCHFVAFMVYSIYIASVVYPILTHWGWSEQGWMAHGYTLGEARISYVDFAGSGLVHLCGGTISLIAAVMMGPRIGRFAPGARPIQGHSVPLVCLGGFILMFGFLAFNGGSTSDISTPNIGQSVARAMTNTIMSGSFAALGFMFIYFARKRKWSVLLTINACLTGMVSACAGCNNAEIWSSCITGSGAGIAYMLLSEAAIWFKVDDPLDAFAVHAGGGIWGLFSVCFVGSDGLVFAVFGDETDFARAGA